MTALSPAALGPRTPAEARLQQLRITASKLRRNGSAMFGLVLLIVIFGAAIFAPLLATHDIYAQNLANRLAGPSAEHWLGTDELGRDIWSRLLYGGRITLYIACLTAAISAPIGLIVGMVSGWFGGWVDVVLMRITEIFLAFPSLILALAFVAALGPSIDNAIIAISLATWPPIARLARAETMMIRRADYIAAVRLQGASAWHIMTRHIAPMCVPSVIARVTLNMASIILSAAGLGFLGLGAQPPSPEWGAMLSSARQFILSNGHVAAAPGLAILMTSLAFNLVGDGLRDVLDPRHD
ncbi:ABC transporter permease [Falsirhodobacter halotolerans]|uniref:ABC transporter permease n=1 Tax=Falsirhodobacter halotolerans TaxID=1146892 RepID=UPI001FD5180D|nr:ABC transporter permease [Falsirhodobacter halotolerans]MCJ8140884.1 ABC transporter permease [Falsirhodobacter halotolerans]